jgi:hypothetical protein
MRYLALFLAGFFLIAPALADMYQDSSNAKLPQARDNLGVGSYRDLCAPDTGVKCDGTTDDAAAINAILAARPGVYVAPRGKTLAIGSTLNFRSNYSGLICEAPSGEPLIGQATMAGCVVLKWTGPAGGTMVSVRPPSGGPANTVMLGMRFSGIALQCDTTFGGSKAAVGIEAVEIQSSRFEHLYLRNCSKAGFLGGDLVTTVNGSFRFNQLNDIQCFYDPDTPGDCVQVYADGTDADINGNEFRRISGDMGTGNAVSVYGSDSNTFYDISAGSAGTDKGSALVFGSSRNSHAGNNSNTIFVTQASALGDGGIIVGGTGGTDGACSGSVLTSNSGAFNRYDIGAAVTGPNFAGGTTIVSVTTARKAVLSQACTAGTGLTYAIAGRVASDYIQFFGNSTANDNRPPVVGTGADFYLAPSAGQISVAANGPSGYYVVTPFQNGAHFDNKGATAEVQFRLPDPQKGLRYCFTNVVPGVPIKPFAPAGSWLLVAGVAEVQSISSAMIGATACVEAKPHVGSLPNWVVVSAGEGWNTTTVAGLPPCNGYRIYMSMVVNDAAGAVTYRGALTGGGGQVVPVFCNGTAWEAH